MDIQTFDCSFEGSIQFRLTRGQRNVGLEFAPPAYGVLASAYDAAAGAFPGDFVSSPVGVAATDEVP